MRVRMEHVSVTKLLYRGMFCPGPCVPESLCVCVRRWCARPLPLGPIANYTKPQVTLHHLLHFTHTHTTHTPHTPHHTHTHTHTHHRPQQILCWSWMATDSLKPSQNSSPKKYFWFTIIFVKFVSQIMFFQIFSRYTLLCSLIMRMRLNNAFFSGKRKKCE